MAERSDSESLPLAEEQVVIGKVPVVTGRVRVSTLTEAVDETVAAELARVDVDVTRIPVNRVVPSLPAIRTEGEVTIIPVVEERLVVTTELVLTEEIHVRRIPTSDHIEMPVTLRRQRAVVERPDPETGALSLEQIPKPEGTDR